MCIVEKAKNYIAKKLQVDFLYNRRKKGKCFCSQHNSMPENVVQQLNMKIPDLIFEIIDLQF